MQENNEKEERSHYAAEEARLPKKFEIINISYVFLFTCVKRLNKKSSVVWEFVSLWRGRKERKD